MSKQRNTAFRLPQSGYTSAGMNGTSTTLSKVTLAMLDPESGCEQTFHLNVSRPADVFAYVESKLGLAPRSYELLCSGVLLSRDAFARLPAAPVSPFSKRAPAYRVSVMRYHAFGSDDASTATSSSFATDDDEIDDGDINDDDDGATYSIAPAADASRPDPAWLATHESFILHLIEMFEDLTAEQLVRCVAHASTLPEAVDAALAMHHVAVVGSATEPARPRPPPPPPPPDDVEHDHGGGRDGLHSWRTPRSSSSASSSSQPRKSASGGDVSDHGDSNGTSSEALELLRQVFPDHDQRTLAIHLAMVSGDVPAAIDALFAIDAAEPWRCDGHLCIDLGSPCPEHRAPKKQRQKSRAQSPHSSDCQTLSVLFPKHSQRDIAAALDLARDDVHRAAGILAGDNVGYAEAAGGRAPALPVVVRPSPSTAVTRADITEQKATTQEDALFEPPRRLPPGYHPNAFAILATAAAADSSSDTQFRKVKRKHNKKQGSSTPASPSKKSAPDHRSAIALAAETKVLDPLPQLSRPKQGGNTNNRGEQASLDELYERRAHRFEAARAALKRATFGSGKFKLGGAVAVALADDGHELTEQIREREAAEALRLVRARQSQAPGLHSRYTADFHELTVRQARAIVPGLVEEWWAKEMQERARRGHERRPFTVVVGIGHHSAPGGYKLGPCVSSTLRKMGARFVDESQRLGQLIVTSLDA
ncbi:hypothetical protein BC828DRAFT_375474 [Blastocladiella britannica]|nr:hypothetical protein BC828DRAFT_375474 [Blastocladiella britannica]